MPEGLDLCRVSPSGYGNNPLAAAFVQDGRLKGDAGPAVYYNPYGVLTGTPVLPVLAALLALDREGRVIGKNRADADHDRIAPCLEPVHAVEVLCSRYFYLPTLLCGELSVGTHGHIDHNIRSHRVIFITLPVISNHWFIARYAGDILQGINRSVMVIGS